MNDIYIIKEKGQTYSAHKDFTTLKAWQKCKETKLFFYNKVLNSLPIEEKFALGQQIRRAALSITNNIAEGYGRFNYQEGIQFYRISRGSLYELKDDLITCYDLKFIEKDLYNEGLELIEEAKKLINGFIKYQQNQKNI